MAKTVTFNGWRSFYDPKTIEWFTNFKTLQCDGKLVTLHISGAYSVAYEPQSNESLINDHPNGYKIWFRNGIKICPEL